MNQNVVLRVVLASVVALTACKGKKDEGAAPAPGSGEVKVVEGTKPKEIAPAGGSRKVVKIGAGDGAACAVMDNGGVRCWGKNDGGERGIAPSLDDAATPVDVPGVANAVDIVMGGDSGSSGDMACATTKDKAVWCWGAAAMLPNNKDNKTEPREVADFKGALSIALGGGTGYIVKSDGTVWGWGSPAFNSLADGTQSGGSDKPLTQIPGVTGAKQVAAGQNHACALLGDGTVTCWGYSGKKQLPTAIAGVAGATAMFTQTHRDDTCVLTKDATLCWGEKGEAKANPDLAGVTKISGRNHMCALAADGAVLCWGDNNMGQLGGAGTASKPGKVDGLTGKAIDIAVGHVFTCAALADGSASCWGYNQRGQLGDGTLTDRKVATPVVGVTADKLAAAKTGLDAVQEGATATSWDGLPEKCKNGPIEIVSKDYAGKTFTVKGAKAQSQLGGKTVAIDLADHQFHSSWGKPRGTQGKLSFRLAKVEIKGDKREPVAVDVGAYKLGMKEERLVSPTLETKASSKSLFSISLAGIDAGTLTVSHLDDKWVCGELAIAADGSSVKGPFAAPIAK